MQRSEIIGCACALINLYTLPALASTTNLASLARSSRPSQSASSPSAWFHLRPRLFWALAPLRPETFLIYREPARARAHVCVFRCFTPWIHPDDHPVNDVTLLHVQLVTRVWPDHPESRPGEDPKSARYFLTCVRTFRLILDPTFLGAGSVVLSWRVLVVFHPALCSFWYVAELPVCILSDLREAEAAWKLTRDCNPTRSEIMRD